MSGRRTLAVVSVLLAAGSVHAAQLDRTIVPTKPNPHEGLEPEPPAALVLPELELDLDAEEIELVGGQTFLVRDIRFVGATVLQPQDFAPLRARYSGRDLTFEELLRLRDQVTLLYVDRGYLTSGATIGSLDDGVLTVDLVEGTLAEIRVAGDSRGNDGYLRDYIAGFGPMDPVNVFGVEERLQMLQSDPHIERVEAELLPGRHRGESVLFVRPYTVQPLAFALEANNYLNPAVGSGEILATFDYLNVHGHNDDFHFGVRAADGLTELATDYEFPINAQDTRVTVFAFGADSKIVTSPFDELDIKARSRTYGAQISHPIKRTPRTRSELFLDGEWRESRTYLLGSGFSFIDGPDEGKVQFPVLRTGWQGTWRSTLSVIAARAQLSFGLDTLGATKKPPDASSNTAEAEFIAFLGQLQWARRLGVLDSQFISRLDMQLADRPLFGLEQIPIGGRWTVRGYRENTLIRDSGVIGSVEWQVPIPGTGGRLELGPFVDWSYSWNEDRGEIGPRNITSAGLSLRWEPLQHTELQVSWGYAFDDIDYPNHDDLQDNGIQARFRWWSG